MSASRIFVFAAVTLTYTTVSFAQNLAPSPALPLDTQHLKSIDSFITNQMAYQKIPGLAVGIYSRGQILLAKGYSQANVELAVPVKAGTLMAQLMPYIRHCHGKFWEMTEEYEERSIPYEKIIPVLIEGGFDGYIASEYEGQRFVQDVCGADDLEQVRRQHVMFKRLGMV